MTQTQDSTTWRSVYTLGVPLLLLAWALGGCILLVATFGRSLAASSAPPAMMQVDQPVSVAGSDAVPLAPVLPQAMVDPGFVSPIPAPQGRAIEAFEPAADPEAPAEADRADAVPTFNGRPLRPVRTITMTVTAYSPDARSCGKWADGYTASGHSVYTNGMKLVAADARLLPFGAVLTIPGYDAGRPVPVLDRGGKIKGRRLDVLFPTHEQALAWGVRELTVTVWGYAD